MNAWQHPTGEWPTHVHLVALGTTARTEWTQHMLSKHQPASDEHWEVWTVNRGVRLFKADLVFVLDEIENEAALDPAYGQALLHHSGPIISTKCEGAYSHAHPYPARAVLASLGMDPDVVDPYWHNSIPMIIAYAMAIGVQTLGLWGCDYTRPDGFVMEADRANCEHWCGRAAQAGMQIMLPPSTTLYSHGQLGGQLHVYGLVNQRYARGFLQSGPEGMGSDLKRSPDTEGMARAIDKESARLLGEPQVVADTGTVDLAPNLGSGRVYGSDYFTGCQTCNGYGCVKVGDHVKDCPMCGGMGIEKKAEGPE